MSGVWIDVIDTTQVTKITALVLAEADPIVLQEYLVERFRKVLSNSAISLRHFDEEATVLLVDLIRKNAGNHNLVYSTLKTFVYHTYMVCFHQMQNDEFRLLRYKIRRVSDPNAVY